MDPNAEQPKNDRVSYSLGMKVGRNGRPSSLDVHCSFSTDVQAGETADDATKRARAHVEKWTSWRVKKFTDELEAESEERRHRVDEEDAAIDQAIERKTKVKKG